MGQNSLNLKKSLIPLCALALISIALAACGKHEDDKTADVLSVGAPFTSYVTGFEAVSIEQGAAVKVTNLVIQFGPVQQENERGACEITPGQTPTIVVNRAKWDRLTDLEREEFLYHELGHCVLRRLHKATLDTSSGNPLSIMHPVGLDGRLYNTHRDTYLHELFLTHNEF